MLVRRPVEERFWPKVDKRGPEECWPWKAGRRPGGYANFAVHRDGRMVMAQAHRVSWALAYGMPVPAGMEVCHTCDVRHCVNPAHLFIGTRGDNIRDAVQKGRQVCGYALHQRRKKQARLAAEASGA